MTCNTVEYSAVRYLWRDYAYGVSRDTVGGMSIRRYNLLVYSVVRYHYIQRYGTVRYPYGAIQSVVQYPYRDTMAIFGGTASRRAVARQSTYGISWLYTFGGAVARQSTVRYISWRYTFGGTVYSVVRYPYGDTVDSAVAYGIPTWYSRVGGTASNSRGNGDSGIRRYSIS